MKRLALVNKALGTNYASIEEMVVDLANERTVELLVDVETRMLELAKGLFGFTAGLTFLRKSKQNLFELQKMHKGEDWGTAEDVLSDISTFDLLSHIDYLLDTESVPVGECSRNIMSRTFTNVHNQYKTYLNQRGKDLAMSLSNELFGNYSLEYRGVQFGVTKGIVTTLICNIIEEYCHDKILDQLLPSTVIDGIIAHIKKRKKPDKSLVLAMEYVTPYGEVTKEVELVLSSMKQLRDSVVKSDTYKFDTDIQETQLLITLGHALNHGTYELVAKTAKAFHVYRKAKQLYTIF